MKTEYTTDECLQAYYDSLEEQLAEKEAMIDWLCKRLADYSVFYPAEKWKELAQEAMKKDES